MHIWVRLEATRKEDPIETREVGGLRYCQRDQSFRSHTWTRDELHLAVLKARNAGATTISFGRADSAGRPVKTKEWLLARAYIEACGLSYRTGHHPRVRNRDLKRLDKLREEVRRSYNLPSIPVPEPYHPEVTIEDEWRFRRYRLVRWCKVHWLWFLLAGLFLIAFGLAPFKFVGFVVMVFVRHPDRLWAIIRLLAGGVLFMWGLYVYVMWLDRQTTASAITQAKPDRRYTIDNFQERSANGDGHLAERGEISMALTGRSDGLSPKFEE